MVGFKCKAEARKNQFPGPKDDPLKKEDGLKLLDDLKNQLTDKELKLREKQLKDAERYINNANGIDAPRNKSFRNFKEKGVRVDIEVNGGTAFICIVIFILLSTWTKIRLQ